ncbi:MAG: DUF3149 domain-containing protein [bacterium]
MMAILFGSKIGILTVVTVAFVTVMIAYLGWKFNQLSKQPREGVED